MPRTAAKATNRLGEWLAAQYHKEGVTQNEYARRAGVSASTLSAAQRGVTPRNNILQRLAKYSGIDEASMLEIAGVVRALPDLGDDVPAHGRELLRRMARLSPTEQAGVMAVIDQMLSLIEARSAQVWSEAIPQDEDQSAG
jgi:transcriptional regulator with XRE-family HTH domain